MQMRSNAWTAEGCWRKRKNMSTSYHIWDLHKVAFDPLLRPEGRELRSRRDGDGPVRFQCTCLTFSTTMFLKHLETSWNRHVLNNFLCTSRRERWSPWGIKMHQNASTPTNCGISAELKTHKLPGRPAARPALSDPRLNAVLRSKISILWLHEIQSKLLRNLANAGIFLWKGYIQPDSKNNWQFGVLTVIYLLKDEDWTTTSPCSGIYVLTAPTWTEKISHCHRESPSKASQQITGCSLQCCFRRPPLFHRFSFQMLREFCSVLFASLYSIKTRCDYLPDACEFLPQQWVKSFWPTCTSNLCSKLKAKQIYLQSN